MKDMNKNTSGFTIVELLIVIVVIAILAAISIVAYVGIQNTASDSAVKSDLRNFAGKIMEYEIVEGDYPTASTTTAAPGGVRFSVAKSAYATNVHNFVYCTSLDPGVREFIVVARSKSGDRFAYSSQKGLHNYTQTWGGVVDVCNNEGWMARSVSYGYNSNGTWWGWVS